MIAYVSVDWRRAMLVKPIPRGAVYERSTTPVAYTVRPKLVKHRKPD